MPASQPLTRSPSPAGGERQGPTPQAWEDERQPPQMAAKGKKPMRDDLSHLPPATRAEIEAMLARAGIVLDREMLDQFVAAWPQFEALVRRLPRGFGYADEPAHTFRPTRLAAG